MHNFISIVQKKNSFSSFFYYSAPTLCHFCNKDEWADKVNKQANDDEEETDREREKKKVLLYLASAKRIL